MKKIISIITVAVVMILINIPVFSASYDFSSLDRQKRGWGQGVHKDVHGRPVSSIEFNARYGGYNAVFINEESDRIILTFDEGYENGYTEKILDTLSDRGVRAVFFITHGYAKENTRLIERMISEGHILGNHSFKHKSMPTISIEQMKSEIMLLHEYILKEYGYKMTLFRPPMGEFSEQSLAVTASLGYRSVFWSYAYYDYDVKSQPEPSSALKKVTENAHKGAIYLLHAVSKTNAEILGDVIDTIRESGYEFGEL
ncbi:MAG: polysaccharide deacetylase family protein [Oscillospiraceae bacterium]|nr:polysaccharide deacetylase family protein [Oscillospiraceae bacterium]